MATELTARLSLDVQPFLQALNNAKNSAKSVGAGFTQEFSQTAGQGLGQAGEKAGKDFTAGLQKTADSGVSGAIGKIKNSFQGATQSASFFGGALQTALGVVTAGAFAGIAGGIASVANAMISGNAEFERYGVQLATLLGSADAAKDRLAELAKFGAETPFELPEIAKAEKTLLGFGLTGQKAIEMTGRNSSQLRTVIGDIAAGTGIAFDEASLLFGKFSSGATGEAISRLQELGVVTREQMKAVGIEFSKSGELVSPLPKALTAALNIAQDKFGGGMKSLSQTFEGQVSTLGDNLGALFRDIGAPLFEASKSIVAGINSFFGSEQFGKIKEVITLVLGSAVTLVIKGFGALVSAVTTAGKALFSIIEPALNVGKVFTGSFSDALTSAKSFVSGISSVLDNVTSIITGKMSVGDAFKKGVDEADKAAKEAKFADETKKKLEDLNTALQTVGQVPVEQEGVKTLKQQIVDLADSSKTALEKAALSEAIARQVPGAVQGIKKIADENGKLISVYDINIDKVKEYAEAQNKALGAEFQDAQAKIRTGFQTQIQQLDTAQSKLKQYSNEINANQQRILQLQEQTAKNPGNKALQDELKTLLERQSDLQKNYKDTKKTIDDTNEALRGTVQQSQRAGAVGKEEFEKLTQGMGRSKSEAEGLIKVLNTPIVPQVDVNKLSEQFEQGLNALRSSVTKNINAVTQIATLQAATKEEILKIQKDLAKESDRVKRESLEQDLQAKQQYLKNLQEQDKKSREESLKNSKEAASQETKLRNNQQLLDYSKRREQQKKIAEENLKVLEAQLKEENTKINDRRLLEQKQLEDSIKVGKERLQYERQFGSLTALEAKQYQAKLLAFEQESTNKRRELAAKQAIDEAEERRKQREARLKVDLETDKKELETLIQLDSTTAEQRSELRKKIFDTQSKQEISAFIDALPAYQKALEEVKARVDDKKGGLFNAQQIDEEIRKLREQIQKGLSSGDFSGQINLSDSLTAALEQFGGAYLEKLRSQQREELKIVRQGKEEVEIARAQAILNSAEREFQIRTTQAKFALEREKDLAGENAALIAQAELKYATELIDAEAQYRAKSAASAIQAEIEIRKGQLEKEYKQEMAQFEGLEKQKVEIQKKYAEESRKLFETPNLGLFGRVAAFAQMAASYAKDMEQHANAEQRKAQITQKYLLERREMLLTEIRTSGTVFGELFKGLEVLEADARNRRLGYQDQRQDLERRKDEELRVARALGKDRLEILKKFKEEEKSLDAKLLGGNTFGQRLNFQIKQFGLSASNVFREFSSQQERAFKSATVNVTSFSQISSTAWLSLGQQFAATTAGIVATGGNFGKAMASAAFDALQALVPILVAQITGISLAQPDSVATFGISAVARIAALTALLQAAVSGARAALGFKEGGLVPGGKHDGTTGKIIRVNEAGEEFVVNHKTTVKNIEILREVNKRNITFEQYFMEKKQANFEQLYLPTLLQSLKINLPKETAFLMARDPVMNPALIKAVEKQATLGSQELLQELKNMRNDLQNIRDEQRNMNRDFRHRTSVGVEVSVKEDWLHVERKRLQRKHALGLS